MTDHRLMHRLASLRDTIFQQQEERKRKTVEAAEAEISGRIVGRQIESLTKIGKGSLRTPPKGNAQTDFFVPSIYDVPLKDDISLMDIAPFRLSKRYQRKAETVRYQVKGAEVEITSNARGMATIYDYDIVLMMISELTERAERWRKGQAPVPERYFAPGTYEILKFCQRPTKGQAYQEAEAALNRLAGTQIRIVSEKDNWRRAGVFNLIDGYTVLSKTDSGRIAQVSIGIPGWVYDGVVREKPTVLTYNPDYFLLKGGVAKFLYRLARKGAGNGEAVWSLKEVHANSGSQGSMKEFSRAIRELIAMNDLPDYELALIDHGRKGPSLKMTKRD